MALQPTWTPHHCGVQANNLHLSNATPTQLHQIKSQLAEHGCIYFTKTSTFTPQDHITFCNSISTGLNINRFFPHVPNHHEISLVQKKKDQRSAIGERFHADHTYDLAPALGSMLVARQLPLKKNLGDTVFVDMRKAYATLPEEIKKQLVGLRAVHSSRHYFGKDQTDRGTGESLFANQQEATQDHVHPVVIKSPLSGKPSLFINPGFTLHFEGQTPAESKQLLEYLYHHAVQIQHMHRFVWEENSAVLWDNRAVWHCALNDYHGHLRCMYRITMDGVPLESYDGSTSGSEIYTGVQSNPVEATHWGESFFDLPFVDLAISTFVRGMNELDYSSLGAKNSPGMWLRAGAHVMGLLGIQPKL